MGRTLFLKDQRFGRLLVIGRGKTDKSGNSTWVCLCDCGAYRTVNAQSLCKGNTKSCGCLRLEGRKAKDRVGEKFGKLTIVRRIKGGWGCLCDCGQKTSVWDANWKVTQSCGCMRKLPWGRAARNSVLRQYRHDAEYRNLTWNLTEEEFDQLVAGNCHYCGEPPANKAVSGYKSGDFAYNGIDRKDSGIGYEPYNVVSCCWDCNEMKGHRTKEDFLLHIEKVAGFQTTAPYNRDGI